MFSSGVTHNKYVSKLYGLLEGKMLGEGCLAVRLGRLQPEREHPEQELTERERTEQRLKGKDELAKWICGAKALQAEGTAGELRGGTARAPAVLKDLGRL